MALSKEFKVGLLALVAGVLLYFGFNFLKGVDFFSPTNRYVVIYDKIDGLTVSNPVQINGLSVGAVREIVILQNRDNQLAVSIDVDDKIQLNDSTLAVLSDNGLLGGKFIDLKIGHGKRPLEDEDTLRAFRSEGLTAMLASKANPVMQNLDSLMHNLNALVVEYKGLSVQVKRIMANVEGATGDLNSITAENRAKISTLIANANSLSASLAETGRKLGPIMSKMNTFADTLNALELAAVVAKANQAMSSLQATIASINSSNGTIGKLINNDSLYTNANRSMRDLDLLLRDLKANPKRYVHFSVFGKKDKTKPVEDEEPPAIPTKTVQDTTKQK